MAQIKFILVVLFIAIQPSGAGWRGIVPFHSTRADVERLLGRGSDFCNCLYKTESENVQVDYLRERCAKEDRIPWNLPPDTVVGITIHPRNRALLCELELDINKFKKTEDPELRGTFYYSNDEKGITYYVLPDGRVQSITYFGSRKDRTNLRCQSKT